MDRPNPIRMQFERLPLTPFTLHADVNVDGFDCGPEIDQPAVEIAGTGAPERSICAQVHRCLAQPSRPESVMLTSTTCHLLQVGAGDSVVLRAVALKHVQVVVGIFSSPAGAVVVSRDAATLLDAECGDHLGLCPTTYRHDRPNLSVAIDRIADEPESNGEPTVFVDLDVAEGLGIAGFGNAYIYRSTRLAGTPVQPQVLQHPGFCYLRPDDLTAAGIADAAVVELRRRRRAPIILQVHPLTETMGLTGRAYLDPAGPAGLDLSPTNRITVAAVPAARLFWPVREDLDDVNSKALNRVTLPEQTLTSSGFVPYQVVEVLAATGVFSAKLHPSGQDRGADVIGMMPLLMRRARLKRDQGFFLRAAGLSLGWAHVGIFNVDEVGSISAIGSDQLGATFAMPCRIEIFSPARGTSIDLRMEPDTAKRNDALIRVPRAVRDLMLLKSREDVLIRAIPSEPNRWFGIRVLLAIKRYVLGGLLLLIIGRRTILLSVGPGHTWDDAAQVCRLSPEAFAVLGIVGGDHVRVSYRGRSVSRVALMLHSDALTTDEAKSSAAPYTLVQPELQIKMDAMARDALAPGNLGFGTVVEVSRDMKFILVKSLNLTILPIVGTVVTVVTLLTGYSREVQIGVGIVLSVLFFYLALSVERAKVR